MKDFLPLSLLEMFWKPPDVPSLLALRCPPTHCWCVSEVRGGWMRRPDNGCPLGRPRACEALPSLPSLLLLTSKEPACLWGWGWRATLSGFQPCLQVARKGNPKICAHEAQSLSPWHHKRKKCWGSLQERDVRSEVRLRLACDLETTQ